MYMFKQGLLWVLYNTFIKYMQHSIGNMEILRFIFT